MAKYADVRGVQEGSTFNGPGGGTVGPPCEINNGFWFCNTHRHGFQNQFQKDIHIHSGTHELVWLCLQHGAEQP